MGTGLSKRYIDLFAGIGGLRIPFDELGYECVLACEWDTAAQRTYETNFGHQPVGDIRELRSEDVPDHDLLLAGFPCQPFSIIGQRKGFDDTRGTLFFEIARILAAKRPAAFLLENVKQLVTHDGGRTLRTIMETLAELGYHAQYRVLNALDFGLPQKRERVVIVGFREWRNALSMSLNFERSPYDLSAILEPDTSLDPSLWASPRIRAKRERAVAGQPRPVPSVWHENKSGHVSMLPYSCALRTGASYNYLLINGERRPSSRELLRLQGFPEWFKIVVSHADIRRQTGNSVPIPMIRAIARRMDGVMAK